MNCPKCGAAVPARDVNIMRMFAKCEACSNVFSFVNLSGKPEAAEDKRVPPPRPKGLRIENWGGNLRLSQRWFQ